MKRHGITMCLLALCAGAVPVVESAATPPDVKLRVGVYDSRAIAVAFAWMGNVLR